MAGTRWPETMNTFLRSSTVLIERSTVPSSASPRSSQRLRLVSGR